MLQYPLRIGPTDELVWYVAEQDALRRVRPEVSSAVRGRLIAETRRWVMRDLRGGNEPQANGFLARANGRRVPDSLGALLDRFGESAIESWSDDDWERFTLQALWRVCCDGVRDLPMFVAPPPERLRHRDLLLEATGEDADALVNGLLIRFCSAFLDQGLAAWPLPRRDEGFLRAFCALYRRPGGPSARWRAGLAAELARLEDQEVGPLASIRESLDALGVVRPEWVAFLSATLLALRGWAGMVRQIEERGDRVVHPVPRGSLVDFLAVRLLLDRHALAYTAREALGYTGPLAGLRETLWADAAAPWPPSVEQRAFPIFQLAQVVGLSPDLLHRLSQTEWGKVMEEIETFAGPERRRVFHLAYERRFYTQTLDAIALHARKPAETPRTPRFQAIFCIDEREESFRRHLEELAPEAETFGTAGFFSVAMYFRGAADAHFVPLCPAVIRPQHWVVERVVESRVEDTRRRVRTRRILGMASHRIHTGSRSLTQGGAAGGARGAGHGPAGRPHALPPPDRPAPPQGGPDRPRAAGHPAGPGAARRRPRAPRSRDRLHARRDDRDRREGAARDGADLAIFAAGGDPGPRIDQHEQPARIGPRLRRLRRRAGRPQRPRPGPDAQRPAGPRAAGRPRADDPRRDPLHRRAAQHQQRGRHLLRHRPCPRPPPPGITGDPLDHRPRLRAQRARAMPAVPVGAFDALARRGPAARRGAGRGPAQVRPEWGHATNAITIVGRREWTRGLFLDRRAFLTSYDPAQDDAESSVLARILSAVFPVCSGISLEYYFSYVDNTGWGCGTKLPHNITALVGVMDGYLSDLRTGLPWQMVEIHEPMRSLFIIETTPEAMLRIMERNEGIRRLCVHGWLTLALVDSKTQAISVFRDGTFQPYRPQSQVLPRAASSVEWYRGWRDHLEFAEIEE